MDFGDFHHDKKHHEYSHHHKYDYGRRSVNDESVNELQFWKNQINNIQSKPKLKILIIVLIITLLLLTIGLVVICWPLLLKFISYIGQHGIDGVITRIVNVLNMFGFGSK